jgi:hypothetical protein
VLKPPVAGAGKEGRKCRDCMNEKQGRGVVSNIKALGARRVDSKTSVVGCGGGGTFFVLFGSRDTIFWPDNMLAPLRYTIDMNDAFPR